MDDGRAARIRALFAVLAAYDAHPGGPRPRTGIVIDVDTPPRPGDRVLVIEGTRARIVPFEEWRAPVRRVWLVGIVRVVD